MDENKRERLKEIYRHYNRIDWIIAILIVAAFVFGINLPPTVLSMLFIVGFVYTAWTVWLYIKVWPIKEIRDTGTYVFDWFLTIGLTVFEVYLLYITLTDGEPFWIGLLETV